MSVCEQGDIRNNMTDITLNDIYIFSEKQLWPVKGEVTEATSLVYDFNIAGLDGKEYMDEFSKTFSVDLEGFDWVIYFGPEIGGNPLSLFYYLFSRFILGESEREIVGLPDLNLGHLIQCANNGKWSNPNPL